VKLRTQFIGFVVFVLAILLGLALWVLPQNKWLFIGLEVLLAVALLWSIHLYRAFLRPLNLIAAGVETIKDKDFQTKFLTTGQPEMDQLIDVYNRMIDELRDERTKQREQHYFLERLIHATPTGVLILDLEDKISLLNPAAATLLRASADEILGRTCDDLPGVLGGALRNMSPGESRVVRLGGLQTYRCRKSHFLDRGFHRHFLLIEELTREILNSQKSSYTSVIRMMSHEVNNTVGAVNSILQSSLEYAEQLSGEDREEMETVFRVAMNRNDGLNSFMSKLASVVRVPAPEKDRYDLHDILKSVHVLVSAECQERAITWDWQLASQPVTVNVDAHQIEQALINIARNAIEAIDREGTITVHTSEGPPRLVISDTGSGISPEACEKLFTPFYSTKRNGQGVGLTLIREILDQHDCSFNLDANDSGGARFRVEFSRH
jgi:nitrogen fixation/metabolism regulation signal transduction histidine kinase